MTPAWFFSSSEINPADCGCGSGALTSSFGGSGLLAWPMACPMRLWTNPLCKMAPAWSFNPSGINPEDSGWGSDFVISSLGFGGSDLVTCSAASPIKIWRRVPAWSFNPSEMNPADSDCGSAVALISSFGESGLVVWPMAWPMRFWTNPLCKMAPAWSFIPSGMNPVEFEIDSALGEWCSIFLPVTFSAIFCTISCCRKSPAWFFNPSGIIPANLESGGLESAPGFWRLVTWLIAWPIMSFA